MLDVQVIQTNRVLIDFRLVEVLLPRGPIGAAPRAQRRSFLRDRLPVPGVALSGFDGTTTQLSAQVLRQSDWLPGNVAAIYGVPPEQRADLVAVVAQKEHVARRAFVHPATVAIEPGGARAAVRPLRLHPLALTRQGDDVQVADAAPPRCVPAMPMNRPPLPTSGTRPTPADASTLEDPRFGNGSLPMTALRLYLLSDESREAETLAEQLRSRQFEVDVLSDIDELVELMGALPADVVLVDRMHAGSIERIGEAMKPIRMRANQPIRMALITETDDVMARLSARRAGMDAVLVRPHGGIDVGNQHGGWFCPEARARRRGRPPGAGN
jgi:CheY-like chemotaxis protein